MTILATTYAVNPYKGSEDGMGWNFVLQISRFNKVIAITRKNNKEHIETYMNENPNELYKNIEFRYYDLPKWARFWKKGSRGAMLYYYLWQMFMPLFIIRNKIKFDIAHNLNFHNDWTPSFLWLIGKPLVWGPVGHHPKIKKDYLKDYSFKVKLKNNVNWLIKNMFWRLDPFLRITKWKSKKIICMNSSVFNHLKNIEHKSEVMPSVASERLSTSSEKVTKGFNVISVGRLTPLKGFDMTIKSFAKFLSNFSILEKDEIKLTLVGSGSHEAYYKKLVVELGIEKNVKFIPWIERKSLVELYESSSVFLFPSHEGAGMVVSEALSFGLPVVTLDNYGPGEFIDESCGIKVKQNKYENVINDLSCSLYNLLRDESLMNKLSEGAKIKYESYFNWNNRGNKLKQVYQELLTNEKFKEGHISQDSILTSN